MRFPDEKQNMRLAADEQAAESKTKAFFLALWTFNAITTGLFGFRHLAPLFQPFFAPTGMTTDAILTASQFIGAFAAVLVLDGGYKLWETVRIERAKAAGQTTWASIGEQAAFWVSVFFTVSILAEFLAFRYITPSLAQNISLAGSILFVIVTALHLVCMRQFQLNDPQTAQRATHAYLSGLKTTEGLKHQKRVWVGALKSASVDTEENSKEAEEMLRREWGGELIGKLLPESTSPQNERSKPVIIAADHNGLNADKAQWTSPPKG